MIFVFKNLAIIFFNLCQVIHAIVIKNFVTFRHSHPNLIFVGKDRSLPSKVSVFV
jgi:hypothetical protein